MIVAFNFLNYDKDIFTPEIKAQLISYYLSENGEQLMKLYSDDEKSLDTSMLKNLVYLMKRTEGSEVDEIEAE